MSEIILAETSTPNTPATGKIALYAKNNKAFYSKDSNGVEVPLGGNLLANVAWDALGTLIVGSGVNGAGRLAVGSGSKYLLMSNSDGPLGMKWHPIVPSNRITITDLGSAGGISLESVPHSWKRVVVEDDFLSGLLTTGNIGNLSWLLSAGTVTAVSSAVDHPGIINLTSTTTSGTVGRISLSNGSTVFSYPDELESFGCIIRPTVDFSASGSMRFGLVYSPSTSADGSQGIYFSKVTSDANWYTVTRDGASIARNSSGVAWTVNKWYLLEVRKNGANWEFWINGVLRQTHSTYIPTTYAMYPLLAVETNTTVARAIDIDYAWVRGKEYAQRWTT